ncbi:MAG: NAD-dependent epimerase/dehydratase [Gemmatimonadetes bacterium]|nr:NAD-dependent epimerase/dehydratase [Gemmatimonadota bacterium]
MIAAITGANGFIGRHLVRRFAEVGWEARPVVRADYASGAIVRLFDNADVVVHAAGATRAPSHAALHASNVDLTTRTLDAAKRAGVKRFMFISSQAAAGPASSCDRPVTETMPAAPVEAYGRSKLEAEELVHGTARMPAVVVRPGAVYGPGDRDFLALHRLARRGVAIHPGNRDQWISIVHVDDLADAILSVSTAPDLAGKTFFIANEVPVQWGEVFRTVAACAGRSLSVDVEIPSPLLDIGSKLGDFAARVTGHAGLLTSDKVALSKAPFWICSSARARAELKFLPRVSLQDGLCGTYHWYLTNGWL